MRDLVIFGTGGMGREVHQLVEDINAQESTWRFLGFLDGNTTLHGLLIHGYPVLGGTDWLVDHPSTAVTIGVGSPSVRRKIVEQIMVQGHRDFATLIHPSAKVGRRVVIGEGSILCANVIATTDLCIKKHVILNSACTVAHDSVLMDYVTLAPGVNVSGNAHIGAGCDLGTNSTFIQGVQIGPWSVIGAGAVVVRDLPSNVTAVGVPAKAIKQRPDGWQQSS